MRCEEIQERFVDLLYDERGTPPASDELRAHIDSCPACREELEGLKSLRRSLKAWGDEPPLSPVVVEAGQEPHRRFRLSFWPPLRYAGIAILSILAFLALANAEITWNAQGFNLRTHMFSRPPAGTDYYTKAEVRGMLKNVLDDSEARMSDLNMLMIQRMMDTLEQERVQDLRYVRSSLTRERGKN